MFNPLEMAELARKIVCKNNKRKYYRFRSSRFYGGIATADCVGCCLRCVFCWSWREVARSYLNALQPVKHSPCGTKVLFVIL